MSSVPVDANSLFQVPGLVAVITGGGTGMPMSYFITQPYDYRNKTNHILSLPGLGLMMARALATNGAKRVYIAGRRLDKLQAAASSHPDILIPVVCDVTSKDSLAALAAKVKEEVGYVNLVVCNSGISGPGVSGLGASPKDGAANLQKAIWDAWSMEEFTKTFEVNCTAVFFTGIAFLELLDLGNKPENRAGGVLSQIVITGSIASYIRLVVSGFAYVASKAAVLQMMKALATYFAPFQIRSNAICPGKHLFVHVKWYTKLTKNALKASSRVK